MDEPKQNEFEKATQQNREAGFLAEFWGYVRANKKFWLIPLLVLLLGFGILILLAGTGLAPFIYTLF